MKKTELQEVKSRARGCPPEGGGGARDPGLSGLRSLCSEPLRYAALIDCELSGLHTVNTPEVFIFQDLQSACCVC